MYGRPLAGKSHFKEDHVTIHSISISQVLLQLEGLRLIVTITNTFFK